MAYSRLQPAQDPAPHAPPDTAPEEFGVVETAEPGPSPEQFGSGQAASSSLHEECQPGLPEPLDPTQVWYHGDHPEDEDPLELGFSLTD